MVDDYRGAAVWDKETGKRVEITTTGSLPTGLTMESPDGIPFPEWINEQWVGNKLLTFQAVRDDIHAYEENKRLESFIYTHRGTEYTFAAKRQAIHGTHNRCVSVLMADPLAGGEPVPTPAPITGYWLTDDIAEGEVTPTMVEMSVAEFITFACYFYDVDAAGRGKALIHIAAIETLYHDPNATAADIAAYDYTTGW